MRLVNVLRVATLYVCDFERKRFFMLSPSYPIGAEKNIWHRNNLVKTGMKHIMKIVEPI